MCAEGLEFWNGVELYSECMENPDEHMENCACDLCLQKKCLVTLGPLSQQYLRRRRSRQLG